MLVSFIYNFLFLFFMLLKEHLSQGHVCPKLEKPSLKLCSPKTLNLVADWVEISKACQSLPKVDERF